MSDLFHQLGINGKLLLAQGINFLVLLVVLTVFVYRPLLRIVKERQKKIAFGLQGAEEAKKRVAEAEEQKEEIISEANTAALRIVGDAEKDGQRRAQDIVHRGEEKGESIVKDAMLVAEQKKQEEMQRVLEGAKALVRKVVEKTVELDPSLIDEKLIGEAVSSLKGKRV